MYRTLLIPLLVVRFMLGGCNGTATNNDQQKADELTELRSQVLTLQQRLVTVTDERDQLRTDLRMKNFSLKIVLEDNEILTQRAEKAESQLVFARSEFKKAFANFDATLEQCRTVKNEYEADRSQLRTENGKLRGTVGFQAQQIISLTTDNDANRQWKNYHKKVAERSIFRHGVFGLFFGDGKPPLPQVADPGD